MAGSNPTLLYWNADGLLANDRAGAFSLTGSGAVRFQEVGDRVAAYIEEGTTNYISNPRVENDQASWDTLVGATNVRILDTERIGPADNAKFMRYTTPGVAINEGGQATGERSMTGTAASFTGSIYVKGTGTLSIYSRIYYTDSTFTEGPTTVITLTSTWTRYVATPVVIDTTKTAATVRALFRTNVIQAITFDVSLAQMEQKTYATTYADGSMGTGYAWIGTAHGSQSLRTATSISFANSNRITPKQGSIVVRYRPDYSPGSSSYLMLAGTDGVGDHVYLVRTSSGQSTMSTRTGTAAPRQATSSNQDAVLGVGSLYGPSVYGTATYGDVSAGVPGGWSIARGDWGAATVGVRLNTGVRASVARVDTITADAMGSTVAAFGGSGGIQTLNGWISEVLVVDRVLTADEFDTLDSLANWSFDTLEIPVPPPVYLVRYKRGEGLVGPGVITVDMTYYRAHRDNTWLENISRHISGGEIAVDLAQPTPMTLKAEVLTPGYLANFADCIAPVMTLTWVEPDTHETLKQTEQVGLYTVMPPTREWSAHGGSEQLDGRDVLWFLAAKITAKPYSVPTGQNLGEAIQSLCLQAGIRHAIQTTGNVMEKRRTWPPGTTHLAIANDLCKLTGFYPLFVDRTGRARGARSKRVYQMRPARHLSSADGVIVNTVSQRPDPDRICNEVTVIGNKPGETAYRAYRLNNDPSSPTSTVSLGYTDYAGTFRPTVISKFEEDTGLTTQDAVDQRADLLMDRGSTMFVRQTVWTLPVIDWSIHDLNELDILTDGDVEVSAGSWRWDKLRLGTGVDALVEWEMAKLQPWADVS